MPVQRALLSVSDKSGLEDFARRLDALGIELLSTGGTAAFLRKADLPVTDVSDYTGYPELFGGRVKTLHPKVHGGILHRRDVESDAREARENEVPPIDLVVVNLYPFEETIKKDGITMAEAIEQIDVGGPTMVRAAAKNSASVAVVTDPSDYDAVATELEEEKGETRKVTRERLAIKAFQRTAAYDTAIARHLNSDGAAAGRISIDLPLAMHLRYGDNPHQEASLYGSFESCFHKLQGKELSYTNVLDIEAASGLISEFSRPTVAILKHTNPCGVGSHDEDLREAWQAAFETDRQAPFGGVIATNRPLTESLARVISEIFTDIIIAPEFEAGARAILQKKKNLRLIERLAPFDEALLEPVIRSAPGGVLVMDPDPKALGLEKLEKKVKTERPPTQAECEAMKFAWKIVKHVRSNAIVFAGADRTLGIGAGQMSRVDSVKIAAMKAAAAGLDLKGSVVASDAMFPFADGLVTAAEAGASAAIQPGGSMRDEEVIAAANEHDMAMVFTGNRHFLH